MSDHYESPNGSIVSVLGTAYNMETGEDMVLYYPLTHPERYYVRSRRNFSKRYKKKRGTDNEKL